VARTLALEGLADLFANPSDISQIEIAVRLTRRTDANEGQFRLADRLYGIASSTQPARLDSGGHDFPDVCFNDGRLPAVDQVDFGRERVDPNDLMSVIGEATRRNGSDITQSKNADSQNAYPSLMLSGLDIVIC
jgi:hypothetical protein